MSSLLIDDETFARCHILSEVVVDDIQDSNIVGVDKLSNAYLAKCRGSFNLKWDHPHDPTNIKAYEECTTVPGIIPYYWRPKGNEALPPETQNVVIRQPSYVSILPLLISARHYKVDIQKYDIISERNSFRKITMNNEDYVISVQKFGNTVFLRRHDERPDTMNDVGHRFEQLCKPGYNINAFYYQLIEGNVDNLRTLISGETDAILENEHPIELKCSEYDDIYWKYLDQHWLQTFLSGVDVIVFGKRSRNDTDPQLDYIKYFLSMDLIGEPEKNRILQRLRQVLQFLKDHVKKDKVYLLSSRICYVRHLT
ncbi:unnamed protein product [Adineta steineri]|uniref:Decapping nuclease n=1 Tax=Adineta steineri TaxID=433720 RepID=A0A815DKY7_9BILA|nr:unnamed protein product [Adineta steineri]CAF1575273.1 unnamed protein product [Adineta steineri]